MRYSPDTMFYGIVKADSHEFLGTGTLLATNGATHLAFGECLPLLVARVEYLQEIWTRYCLQNGFLLPNHAPTLPGVKKPAFVENPGKPAPAVRLAVLRPDGTAEFPNDTPLFRRAG